MTEFAENVKIKPGSGLLLAAGTNWSMLEQDKQKSSNNHHKTKEKKKTIRNTAQHNTVLERLFASTVTFAVSMQVNSVNVTMDA